MDDNWSTHEEREDIKEIFDGMCESELLYWSGYLEGLARHADLVYLMKQGK